MESQSKLKFIYNLQNRDNLSEVEVEELDSPVYRVTDYRGVQVLYTRDINLTLACKDRALTDDEQAEVMEYMKLGFSDDYIAWALRVDRIVIDRIYGRVSSK